MGLLDDLKDNGNFVSMAGPRCRLCTLLKTLTKEEQKFIAERLADPNISGEAISRVLQKNGHKITGGVVQRHRRGLCVSVA